MGSGPGAWSRITAVMRFMQPMGFGPQPSHDSQTRTREAKMTSCIPTTATATSWDPSTASTASSRLEAEAEARLGSQWFDVVTIDVKEEQPPELPGPPEPGGRGCAPTAARSTLASARRLAER